MQGSRWLDCARSFRHLLRRKRNPLAKSPAGDCAYAFGHLDRPARGPVFIGGTGRSGTTVLARLLGQHPRIFVYRWETQLIVAPGGLVDLLRNLNTPAALAQFSSRMRGPWFRRVLYAGQPEEYSAGLCADLSWEEVEPVLAIFENLIKLGGGREQPLRLGAEFLDALSLSAMERAKAHRWGEKTPRNIFYIAQLWRLFPNMRFVHILRDGRDVVSSMLENGFWPIAPSPEYPSSLGFRGEMSFEKAVDYWVEMLKIARYSAAQVPPENYLEIRLEDLAEDPVSNLQRLMDFLGEPLTEELLQFDLSRARAGRWKKDLSAAQIRYFHQQAGEILEREGYTV